MMAGEAGPRGLVKSPLDVAGGLFLLAIAVLGFAGAFNLPTGTLSGIGSGLLPKVVALLVGAFGVLLIVQGLLLEGDRLEQWHLRGPVFVLGGVAVFALLIRGSDLAHDLERMIEALAQAFPDRVEARAIRAEDLDEPYMTLEEISKLFE